MVTAPGTAPIRELLASRAFLRWSGPVALARMPPLMAAVAVTTAASLFLGDPDRGGSVSAAYVLGLLLLAPLTARWADRWGIRRVVRCQLLASALAWVALSGMVQAEFPPWTWHLCALLAGACLAGSAGLLRSTLSRAVRTEQLRVASSLDATALDVIIMASPLVVAAAVVLVPVGATAVIAAVSLLAAAGLGLVPDDRPGPAMVGHGARPLLSRALVAWALAGLAFGMALGAVEVGAVSIVVAIGWSPTKAWVIYAVLTLSSVIGGLLDARTADLDRADHRPRVAVMATVMVTGGVLTAVAPGPVLLLTGTALIGLPAAALLSARSLRTEAVTHPSARARAFTAVFAAQALGFAIAGLLLSWTGHQNALIIGAASVFATTVLVLRADPPAQPQEHPAGQVPT